MSTYIETDEDGALVLTRAVLGDTAPHARYEVLTDAGTVWLRPAPVSSPAATSPARRATPDEWMSQWKDLAERIDRASITDRSGVDVLSEMRG